MDNNLGEKFLMADTIKYLDKAGLQTVWSKIKEQDAAITQLFGYFMNGDFYSDSTYSESKKLERSTKHIYIDKNGDKGIYYYNGTEYKRAIQQADGSVPGIMKLYNIFGTNTDGTVSQKCVTDGLKEIQFSVSETINECLVLNNPTL